MGEERQQRPVAAAARDRGSRRSRSRSRRCRSSASRTTSYASCSCPEGPCARRSASRSRGNGHCGESMGCRYGRPTVSIPTDLLTPLGAYLRLREGAAASFLLESVEQGRLGRHSFIGSGTRLVSFEEAEALDAPVVGYLAYDHVAKLEPTVPLPADGPELAGEPLRRRRDARPLRPRQRHGGGAGRRRGRDRRPAREGACVSETQAPLGALNHAAHARPGHVRDRACERIQELHPRRGRVPGRPLAARGADDVRLGARALPGAAPGQPLALPLPARARRASR